MGNTQKNFEQKMQKISMKNIKKNTYNVKKKTLNPICFHSTVDYLIRFSQVPAGISPYDDVIPPSKIQQTPFASIVNPSRFNQKAECIHNKFEVTCLRD